LASSLKYFRKCTITTPEEGEDEKAAEAKESDAEAKESDA